MKATDALARTILLVYDYVPHKVAAAAIADAFQNCVVRCVASPEAINSPDVQQSLGTFASLVTRMGAQIELDVADAPIEGSQPPLAGTSFVLRWFDLGARQFPERRSSRRLSHQRT